MLAEPTADTAAAVTGAMTGETVKDVQRLLTGNQNYVYGVKTAKSSYVIRMTSPASKNRFVAALYWQEKLLPLGVPLARFLGHDLDGEYSAYPCLLMPRLPGADLGIVYESLSSAQKKSLAYRMKDIHASVAKLPDGPAYGYSDSYEAAPPFKTWPDLLEAELSDIEKSLRASAEFPLSYVTEAREWLDRLGPDLSAVPPRVFLHDTTVKNVIVHQGALSGIVDVDSMCFGDPLFTLSLTYAGSEIDGHDLEYADYWAEALELDKAAQQRLHFYRLIHTLGFMSEHSVTTVNGQTLLFNTEKLRAMYLAAIARLKKEYE